jgi:hypothetical protein
MAVIQNFDHEITQKCKIKLINLKNYFKYHCEIRKCRSYLNN